MNKFKVIGFCLALALLIAAIAARLCGGELMVSTMLPILSIGLWALTVVDILSYRKYASDSKAIRNAELMRIISLGVISFLLSAALILSLIF